MTLTILLLIFEKGFSVFSPHLADTVSCFQAIFSFQFVFVLYDFLTRSVILYNFQKLQ